MNKKMPIGISDFEKIIIDNYYYVDKSLLIAELFSSGAQVTLIPRPRRFGKTLNMTMLRAFFEKSEQNKTHLFSHLAIAQHQEIMAKQGTYPVVFLTFKDVKSHDWDVCFDHLRSQIIDEFRRHAYLLTSDALDANERIVYEQILARSASIAMYERSLKDLTVYLKRYHKKSVIVLIDEYDAPIHAGFVNDYYHRIIDFLRVFLGAGLKDNAALELGVMTGILRVAKESIFSGLNNLRVCTFFDNRYADKFGLTQAEVDELAACYQLSDKKDAICQWYDGYTSGKLHVYNPWSIINLIDNEGLLQPYWVNTSDNEVIKRIIQTSAVDFKDDFAVLIAGGSVSQCVNENIVFQSVYSDPDTVWNFFLLSGYLTYANFRLEGITRYADFSIPNAEVRVLYESIIKGWFRESIGLGHYQRMLNALVDGNTELFGHMFQDFAFNSLSYFDVSGKEPEQFYHAFVLGMLVMLKDRYQITSNRESGYGRYDVVMAPRDLTKRGIVIEFKRVDHVKNETLELAADRALEQIKTHGYTQALCDQGVKQITLLGIAFDGKQALVKEGQG